MLVLVALALTIPAAILSWLVFTPLRIRGTGLASTERPSSGQLVVGWWPLRVALEGTSRPARVRMHLLGLPVWAGRPEEAGSAPGAKRTGRWLTGWTRGPSAPVAAELARFVRAQRRNLRLDRLQGALRFGFEDPADTGQMDGWLWALRAAYPADTAGFEHEALWAPGTHLDARGELQARIFVGRILLAAVPMARRLERARRRESARSHPRPAQRTHP